MNRNAFVNRNPFRLLLSLGLALSLLPTAPVARAALTPVPAAPVSALPPVGVNAFAPPAGMVAAKGDGLTNDLPALQKLCDYANAHNQVVNLPSGTYRLNGTLHLMKLIGGYHTGMVLRALTQRGGQGGPTGGVVLLEGLPNQKAVVEIGPQACIGNVWEGLTIDGGPASLNTQYAVWSRFANWSQWRVTDCEARNAKIAWACSGSMLTGLGSGATATAQVDGAGHVTGLTPTTGGKDYSQEFPPYVIVEGGTGYGDAFFTANVNAAGQVASYTQVSPGHGYPAAPRITLVVAGGGHGEENNFFHCAFSGSQVAFESDTDADQNYGIRWYGCFGGVGLGGTLLQLGIGYTGQMSIHGGDFTLQHDATHPSTLIRTPGFGTIYMDDLRAENCDTVLDEQGGSGGTKITLQSAVLTNSDGPFIKGGANGGETTLTLRDCQIFATNAAATALNWQVKEDGGYFDKFTFDGTDFGYKNVDALLGNPHVTLRDCRLSNGTTNYPGNRPLANQSASY